MPVDQAALDVLKRFGKAFNSGDIDAILACVTDDFEWVMGRGPDAPDGRIVRGRDDVAQALRERAAEYAELKFSETKLYQDGDCVMGTFRARGRYADGRPIDTRGCDFYTIRDGRIARKDSYWKLIA